MTDALDGVIASDRITEPIDVVSQEILGVGRRPQKSKEEGLPNLALVSTYPPTPCGLATFTASLRASMLDVGGPAFSVDVVQVVEGEDIPEGGPEVIGVLRPDVPGSVEFAGRILNSYDAVVIQHEYGIFGPESGWAVIDLLKELTVPAIAVLHTVLKDPSPLEREIIERMRYLVSKFVVQSRSAAALLTGNFGVPLSRIEVIPHGTHPVPKSVPKVLRRDGNTILTWGLIGPGKGLEWSIRALSRVKEEHPNVRYVIAGRTHPKVLEREGETYREMLVDLASELGVSDNILWVNQYMPRSGVHELIRSSDVIVLPYDSTSQTVSGILVEAVTAEVPVVATRFPHAVELASDGAVVAVPNKDPVAMAEAIVSMLNDSPERRAIKKVQRILGPTLTWDHVARRYFHLLHRIAASRAL